MGYNATIDQTDIAAKVLDVITALVDSSTNPMSVAYEDEPALLPGLSLQTITGDPVVKTYLDGTYIANYRFAVYLTQATDDAQDRLDAVAYLNELVNAYKACELSFPGYAVYRRTCDTLPCCIEREQGQGREKYQVTMTLQYKRLRGA